MTDDLSTTAVTYVVAPASKVHPSATTVTNTRVTPVPVQSYRSKAIERSIGIIALIGTAATVWLGIWVTPPDKIQGDLVRLVYIHPGVAWAALYLAFSLAAVSSLLYLWPRTRSLFWDRLAAAAVEVGVVFSICTLVSGAIWGKPTWGVWWAWDARLTLTAVLLVLFLGYLALRRIPAEPDVRAKRSAFVALFAAIDVPLVHFSVNWWNTLHQGATVLNPGLKLKIHGSMALTLLLGFVAITLVFVWLLLVRYRVGVLEDWLAANELDLALVERRSEGGRPTDGGSTDGGPADAGPVDVGPAGKAAIDGLTTDRVVVA